MFLLLQETVKKGNSRCLFIMNFCLIYFTQKRIRECLNKWDLRIKSQCEIKVENKRYNVMKFGYFMKLKIKEGYNVIQDLMPSLVVMFKIWIKKVISETEVEKKSQWYFV